MNIRAQISFSDSLLDECFCGRVIHDKLHRLFSAGQGGKGEPPCAGAIAIVGVAADDKLLPIKCEGVFAQLIPLIKVQAKTVELFEQKLVENGS